MILSEALEAKSIFLILTEQRSGSHYLKGLLNSHPMFFCDKEWFSKKNRMKWGTSIKTNDSNELVKVLLGDCKYRYDLNGKHVGSIIHGHQLDPVVLNLIRSTGSLKVIILHRKNFLARLVSKKVAKERRIFTSKMVPDQQEMPKVVVSRNELSHFSKREGRRLQLLEQYLVENRVSWIKVTYEDLCSNKDSVMRELFAFFGEQYVTTSTKISKQITRHLSESIKNYAELRSSLTLTELKEYLH